MAEEIICPYCGKNFTVPVKAQKNKEIYARFLMKWNACGVVRHKKVTTRMKKAIDKTIKNDDYTQDEIFKAFENYGTILKSPGYFWSYKWTMEDFLNRGLHKFVEEAQPFANNKKDKQESKDPYVNFSCGCGD